MKIMSSFLRDNFILIVIASVISYVLWNRVHPVPKKELYSKSKNSEKVERLEQAVNVINHKKRADHISSQRKNLAARLAVNSRMFTPKVTNQGLQMTFRLQPSPRACKDGDIDLIQQAVGENGKLLLTLEDDDASVLSYKILDVQALKTPYLFPVSFKDTGRTRVFRISLCSNNEEKSCNGLQALDYKKYSQELARSNKAKAVEAGHVFYSYSFGLIKNEVQLFDGTNLSSKQNYSKFLQTVDGSKQQLDFIDKTVAQQKKLGILPLTIQNQNVVFPLYFNDKSKCAISFNRR